MHAVSTGLTFEEASRMFPLQRSLAQKTETRCLSFFCLSGDCLDPERCSALLGVKPTEARAKGEKLHRREIPAPTGEWSIEHDWHICKSLRDEGEAFLPELRPLKDMISQCISEQQLSASFCSVFEVFGKDYPDLELSTELIVCFSDLGVEFSIDWYDFSEFEVIPDNKRTNVGAMGSCIFSNSKTKLVYKVGALQEMSLEEIVVKVLKGLRGKINDNRDVIETAITVFVEVHHGEVPLLVLPVPLLKTMRNMKASLSIKWRRIS